MATAAAQTPSPAPKPISEWAAWARSCDTLTAVVRPDGDTAVDGDTATVPIAIAQTCSTSPGRPPHATATVPCTALRVGESQRLQGNQQQPVIGGGGHDGRRGGARAGSPRSWRQDVSSRHRHSARPPIRRGRNCRLVRGPRSGVMQSVSPPPQVLRPAAPACRRCTGTIARERRW